MSPAEEDQRRSSAVLQAHGQPLEGLPWSPLKAIGTCSVSQSQHAVMASYGAHIHRPTMHDLVMPPAAIARANGHQAGPPVVVCSDRLQAASQEGPRAMCGALGSDWDPAMMTGAPGPARRWTLGALVVPAGCTPLQDGRPVQPRRMHVPLIFRPSRPCAGRLHTLRTTRSDGQIQPTRPPQRTHPMLGQMACPQEDAKVHVLDSVVQGGDAVWEGLRVTDGTAIQLEEHLTGCWTPPTPWPLQTFRAPRRAQRFSTPSSQRHAGRCPLPHYPVSWTKVHQWHGPPLNVHGSTLIIVPEYKGMVYGDEGIRLDHQRHPPQQPPISRQPHSPQQPAQQHPRQNRGQCGRHG